MQQPLQRPRDRHTPAIAPLRVPPVPLAVPPLSLAWPAPEPSTALALPGKDHTAVQGAQQAMAGPDSSGEGEDSYEEAEQDGYLEPVRSLGLAGKRRRSSSSSAERPVHHRRHSDSHEPKPSRHAAPVSTTSYRDGHALSLGFPSTWTPVDDVVLVSTVETMNEEATRRGEGVDWASVAEALPGTRRTRRQVEGRWNALVQQVSEALSYLDDDAPQLSEPESGGSSPSTTATPWTTDEDARLVAAVKHHSPWSSAQPMNAVLASTAASASSSRSAWPAVKARFDSLVVEGEPGPARTAADLAERWRTLQYTAGAHRTRRAQAEAAVELERAEWTPHELAHLVDVVIGLGGSVERNAAGWEGEVKATSRWMQVLHGLGKQTSLVDVCLAWCEAKDGSAGSPGLRPPSLSSLVASSTSRSSTPVVAAESFKREPSPPTASTSTSTHPSSSLATAQLPPLPTRLLSTTTSSERASGRMYTAEEDAIIIADRRAGVKQSITARRLKRPLSGIRGRVKALRKKGVIVDERPGRAQ